MTCGPSADTSHSAHPSRVNPHSRGHQTEGPFHLPRFRSKTSPWPRDPAASPKPESQVLVQNVRHHLPHHYRACLCTGAIHAEVFSRQTLRLVTCFCGELTTMMEYVLLDCPLDCPLFKRSHRKDLLASELDFDTRNDLKVCEGPSSTSHSILKNPSEGT